MNRYQQQHQFRRHPSSASESEEEDGADEDDEFQDSDGGEDEESDEEGQFSTIPRRPTFSVLKPSSEQTGDILPPPKKRKQFIEDRNSRSSSREELVYVVVLQEGGEFNSIYRIQQSKLDADFVERLRFRHANTDRFRNEEEWKDWFALYNNIIEDTAFDAVDKGESVLDEGKQFASGIFHIYDPHDSAEELQKVIRQQTK